MGDEAPDYAITAVIVSWRTGPRLFDCLEALGWATDITEVILVDNGNPADVRARIDEIAAAQPRLKVIAGHGNVGFAAGCNIGAGRANGDYLLFLNPDAVIAPGAAASLAKLGDKRRRPWIVGGQVVGMDGREQSGGRRHLPTPWRAFVQATGLSMLNRWLPIFSGVNRHREPAPKGPIKVGAVSGAFCMMRRDDYAELGGFDQSYFAHVEDIDLCRRVSDAGGEVVYTPDVSVSHEGGTSPASAVRIGRLKGEGLARYYRKFSRRPFSRAVSLVFSPLVVAFAVFVAMLRDPGPPQR